MKALDFPQRNVLLAEDQPEYETLPAYVHFQDVIDTEARPGNLMNGINVRQVPVSATKKIWFTQLTYGNPFQPIVMSTKNPFEDAPPESLIIQP